MANFNLITACVWWSVEIEEEKQRIPHIKKPNNTNININRKEEKHIWFTHLANDISCLPKE